MLNSDARVILLFSSGEYSIPISGGGKGMTWQDVATQGSRVAGEKVLFQAQVDTSSAYL